MTEFLDTVALACTICTIILAPIGIAMFVFIIVKMVKSDLNDRRMNRR